MELKDKIPFKIMSNPAKWLIIKTAVSEDLNLSQLARKIDLSYPNLYRHVKSLKKAGIIDIQLAEKVKNKPAKIIFNPELKKNLLAQIEHEKKYPEFLGRFNSNLYGQKIKDEYASSDKKIGMLNKLLKVYHGDVDERSLKNEYLKYDNAFLISYLIEKMIYEGLLERRIRVTTKGKYLVKKKSKPSS